MLRLFQIRFLLLLGRLLMTNRVVIKLNANLIINFGVDYNF